jgi:transcriptional regulator GlxA family with amidase domain
MSKTFGILLFPDAEELDFVGPWEVFTSFGKYFDQEWQSVLVSQTGEPVRANKGMLFTPDFAFDNCPPLDVLLIPGGQGTRVEENNEPLLDFVRRVGEKAAWMTSVCTGAFILRRAGFLSGRRATTHWAMMNELRKDPQITVVEQRFVHDGNVITAAGVSAGIDMALYLVGLLSSPDVARNVQKFIEYYPEPPYAVEPIAAGKDNV